MNGYAGVPRLDELRARIVERYGSLHAFCKAHPELKRSSVYLVMSGRYPGRSENQIIRIEAALEGNACAARAVLATRSGLASAPSMYSFCSPSVVMERSTAPSMSAEDMADALQEIRCNNCRLLDRRNCLECRTRTRREAEELHARMCRRAYPDRR